MAGGHRITHGRVTHCQRITHGKGSQGHQKTDQYPVTSHTRPVTPDQSLFYSHPQPVHDYAVIHNPLCMTMQSSTGCAYPVDNLCISCG